MQEYTINYKEQTVFSRCVDVFCGGKSQIIYCSYCSSSRARSSPSWRYVGVGAKLDRFGDTGYVGAMLGAMLGHLAAMMIDYLGM